MNIELINKIYKKKWEEFHLKNYLIYCKIIWYYLKKKKIKKKITNKPQEEEKK